MTYRAVDVMGFAGGMTYGVVQAGFELVGKRELADFGVANMEANRHLLGDNWRTEISGDGAWSVPGGGADLVFGNPPCSGFSILTSREHHGVDAKINSCMWHFATYVARARPQVAVMESVRAAFTVGLPLMRALRDTVEKLTGEPWGLHHVFQNALDLGGAGQRPRYFMVLSRIPFGVEYPQLTRRPVLADVIGDLADLDLSWDAQPYRRPATWWSAVPRLGAGAVDGHMTQASPMTNRVGEVLELADWPQGGDLGPVLKVYFEKHGELPPGFRHKREALLQRDFFIGFGSVRRWYADRPARVITGASLQTAVHPWLPRLLTHREAARIMGFPDTWVIKPYSRTAASTWGKGVTTQCGLWIGNQVRRALDGSPAAHQGEFTGEREWLVTPDQRTLAAAKLKMAALAVGSAAQGEVA